MKLNLGLSITLPINWNFALPDYSNDVKDFNDLTGLNNFKNFNSLQIMFSKTNLTNDDIKNIKELLGTLDNILFV